jgi:hypothetical protein
MSETPKGDQPLSDAPVFEEVNLFETALMQGGHNVSAPPTGDDHSLSDEDTSA